MLNTVKNAVLLAGLALFGTPAMAQLLSGGASGGGAIQGGDGAPGSGTGVPGAIVNNTTAQGIGEDDTLSPGIASARRAYYGRYVGLGTRSCRE